MEFRQLIIEHLLPEFCDDPQRDYSQTGFRKASIRVSDLDAANFTKAWHAGLIEHKGRGLYRAARSRASEQFFWQGAKTETVRPITLWLEPVITVAALARLHFEFAWPKRLLGTQSSDWAFDITAFLSDDATNEYIACEVKKTPGEVQTLIDLMQRYATMKELSEDGMNSMEKNAFRKLNGLKARRAPVFWVVGPDGLSRIFKVSYGRNGDVILQEANEGLLLFPDHQSIPSPLLRRES